MEFLKKFCELTRGYSILVTLASMIVVYSYAHYHDAFSFINFVILTIALCVVHMGANLYDDYRDIKKQLKQSKNLSEVHFNSFVPKARLILNGTFSLKQVKLIINLLFSIAIGIGICFTIVAGWPVLLFMLAGGILTLFYPYSYKYCLGEVIIGLIYGPLMIMGAYYTLTQDFNPDLLLLSVAIFSSTLVLLHAHNIMDWEFDEKDNKKTLARMCKNKNDAIQLLKELIVYSYAVVLAGVFLGRFNPYILYVFLTLPIASELIKSMKEYVAVVNVEFKPRWYWGFFENWQTIKENNLEFFMYRFYLARNFGFFFAILATIGVMR